MRHESLTKDVEAKRARLRKLLESTRVDASRRKPSTSQDPSPIESTAVGLRFSFFFFESNAWMKGSDQYKLLFDVARYADDNGFEAIWTPERHFNSFGSPYPAPAIL